MLIGTAVDFVVFVSKVVAAGIAGALLHELAHYLPWLLAGRRPDLDVLALEVRPTAGDDQVRWFDRVAAGAPLALGLAVAPVVAVWPSFPALVGWAVFTVGGAAADYDTLRGKSPKQDAQSAK